MSDLTTADGIELVEATHRHKPISEDAEYHDVTDSVTIDRWSKYGKDRLYLNGLNTGDGWVSLKSDESGGDKWTKVEAQRELNGDELTIKVGRAVDIRKGRAAYTITVRVIGDGFGEDENDEGADADNEQEVACDGGSDVTDHVEDETIEEAIDAHDDPDHEDATTVTEVRDILAALNESVRVHWSEWLDNIESGDAQVIDETDELIVLDTGTIDKVREEIAHHPEIDADGSTVDVVSAVMHEVAREHSNHDWGVTYPFVVRKGGSFVNVQEYVEAVLNGLRRRGVSPGQAWAYYGVEIRGHSRNHWAARCDYSDHSAVSEAVRKAESKLS